ncbi:glycosyltransferase family A protein [Desulfocurvibacter africanus]|uniref:glycosyltransferase family 2 protein n=1 Tax=Desulfocurvibacter africanus TaxID=873 RepID=UPI002FD94421
MDACSLIITTLGRKRELARLLESLVAQQEKPCQVILVDQNPKGYLADIVEPFFGMLPLTLLNTEPKGVSAARNLGLPYVTGDIVAFPDDDCWYLPNTLERVVVLFNEFPELGGLVVSWAERPFASGFQEGLEPVTHINAFRRAGTLVQFYRREVLDGVAYDPLLGPGTGLPYGCGEDTDFLLQVLEKGHIVRRTAEVLVGHPEPDTLDQKLVPKIHAYARGRMHLLRKHKFSFWFKLANIFYPLGCLLRENPRTWRYRKAMFWGRLKAFFSSVN